jgi:hypothetical protein
MSTVYTPHNNVPHTINGREKSNVRNNQMLSWRKGDLFVSSFGLYIDVPRFTGLGNSSGLWWNFF